MTRYDIVVDYEEFNNLHAVAVDGKWGIFDSKTQKELLPTLYDDVNILDLNCFAVKVGDFWGVLRSQHDALTEIRYDAVYNLDKEFIALDSNNKRRLLSKTTTATTREYSRIYEPVDNYSIVKNKLSYGIICTHPLTEILQTQYDWIYHLSDVRYLIQISSNWYIFNAKENTQTLLQYKDVYPVEKGKYLVVKKGHFKGVIDIDLNVIIPLKYDFICYMGQGLFYVTIGYNTQNSLVGAINLNNGTVIECMYNTITKLSNNLFSISDDSGKCALFNGNNRLTEFKYNSIQYRHNSLYVFVSSPSTKKSDSAEDEKTLVGLIDSSGKELVQPIYDDIKVLDNGVIVSKDCKSGICDNNYNLVSKIIYDDVVNIGANHAVVIFNSYYGTFYW